MSGTELAQGYLSVTVGFDGSPTKELKKALGGMQVEAAKTGQAMGASLEAGVADGTAKIRAQVAKSVRDMKVAAQSVEAARSKEEDAARKVRLAEAKLAELRQDEKAKASQILAAEDRLATAKKGSAKAALEVAAAEKKSSDAQAEWRKATKSQTDQVLAEAKALGKLAGDADKADAAGVRMSKTWRDRVKSAFSKAAPFEKFDQQADQAGDKGGAAYGRKFQATLGTVAVGAGVAGFGAKIGSKVADAAMDAVRNLGRQITDSVSVAADFEQRISGIGAVSGASSKEMAQLHDKALQLGADSVYSASESAGAIEELIKAGVGVPDVMNGAADATVALAAASGETMANSATIASNALNAFQLKAAQMPHVADLIAGAANASAIDVGEYGYSLQMAGTAAKTVGMDIDALSVAIAEMGNMGIKGSDAGTSLKVFLNSMVPDTDKAASAMEQYGLLTLRASDAQKALAKAGIEFTAENMGLKGKKAAAWKAPDISTLGYGELLSHLQKYYEKAEGMSKPGARVAAKAFMAKNQLGASAFFDEKGTMRSLDQVQAAMKKAFGGLGKNEQIAAFKTIFGSDAQRAAMVFTANGAEGFNKLSESMKKVTAQDVAATRLGNFRGAMEQLKGSIETIKIQVGEKVLPVLTELAKWATDAVNWMGEHQTLLGGIAVSVGAGVVAWGAYVAVMNAATIGTKVMAAATKVLNFVMKGGTIGLVVAALAALAAGMVYAYHHSETFRQVVDQAFAKVKAAGMVMVEWFMTTAWPIMQKVFGWIGEKATWLWQVALKPALEKARDLASKVFGWFQTTGWPILKTAFAAIGTVVGWLWSNIIHPYFTMMFQIWKSVFGWFRDYAWPIFRGVVTWIGQVVGWLWTKHIKPRFDSILLLAKAVFGWLRDTAWPIARDAFQWIGDKAGWLWNTAIKPAFDSIKSGIDKLGPAFETAKKAIETAWNGLKAVVKAPIQFVLETVIQNGLIGRFNSVAEKIGAPKLDVTVWPVPGLKSGGVIPGTWSASNRDPILGVDRSGRPTVRVEPEEFVTNRDSTRRSMRLLTSINAGVLDDSVFDRMPGLKSGGLVLFGRRLQQMGIRVSEHPDFGGVTPVHVRGSDHYSGNAIDINADGFPEGEPAHLIPAGLMAQRAGYMVLYNYGPFQRWAGHDNHMHISDRTGGGVTDKLKDALGSGWDKVKGAAGTAASWVGEGAAALIEPFKNAVAGLIGKIPGAGIVTDIAKGVGRKLLDGAVSNLTRFISPGGDEDQAESSSSPAPAGTGVERWRSTISQALLMNGLPTSKAWQDAWLRQVGTQSGGNETLGLLQMNSAEFDEHKFPGHGNIRNGLDNALASMAYAKDRYGLTMLDIVGRGHGYDSGGWLQPMAGMQAVFNHTDKPEPVLTSGQWEAVSRLAAFGGAQMGAMRNPTTKPKDRPAVVNVYDVDGVLLGSMRGVAEDAIEDHEDAVARRGGR